MNSDSLLVQCVTLVRALAARISPILQGTDLIILFYHLLVS